MDEQQAINMAKQALADIPDDEQYSQDEQLWNELLSTYRKLKASRPEERSERSRCFAVCLTEYEKVLGYFHTMILSDFEG